jgi:hypothetical protein
VDNSSSYYGDVVGREVKFEGVDFRIFGHTNPTPYAFYAVGELQFASSESGEINLPSDPFSLGSTPEFYRNYSSLTGEASSGQRDLPAENFPKSLIIDPKTQKISFVSTAFVASDGECKGFDSCYASVTGSLGAIYRVRMTQSVTYDAGLLSPVVRLKMWIDDSISTNGLRRFIRDKVNEHVKEDVRKGLWVPSLPTSVGPPRASVNFTGSTVFTASPGVVGYDITLTDVDDILSIPLAFTKNNKGSFVDVLFDGQSLMRINGDDYELDELNIFDLNISAFKGRQGTLSFVINTSGSESAEIFIPESVAPTVQTYDFVTPTLAVPEPEAYAMMLAGLAALGSLAAIKRRKLRT